MSLRPTFMGFESSKSALFVSQKQLDVTGQNLANMSTEGYTRQRADQVSVSNYAYQSRIGDASYNHIGAGTSIEGISQVRDERMDTAFRNSYSETSYYNKSHDMLSEIETIMSEIDGGVDGYGYGLSYGIKEIYTAVEAMSQNVNLDANATIVADAVKNITSILNRTSSSLSEAREAYIDEFKYEVNDANSVIEDICVLNKQISDVLSGGGYNEQYGPNELIDKRNMLLDELASFGKVEVTNKSDGTVNVKLNGHECIKGRENDPLFIQENRDGSVSLKWKSNAEDASIGSGILKASSDIINGRGVNASGKADTSDRGFLYYQDVLDSFATNLAEVLNHTLPTVVDEKGNALAYQKLVGENVYDENGNSDVYTDLKPSAAYISISSEFNADPQMITRIATKTREDIIPGDVYASYSEFFREKAIRIKAGEDGLESGDSQYLMNLIAQIGDGQHTFFNGSERFEGSFQDFITEFSAKLGGDVKYANVKYEASEKYSNELQTTRESITNVSESEETVNMLTYNKAFQAAAKMMTTWDEILDVIINQVGALG